MSVIASQLIAEVSSRGVEATKAQLKSVHDTAAETSGGFKGMLSGMLSFAGGIGITNLLGDAFGFLKGQIGSIFEESMNAQAGMAQTNAVLASTHGISGMTAQAVADLAGEMSHLTMFSDDTVQSAENMLLTFTNIGQNVFPEATKTVLDMSQALGQDAKSSAIQLGKALNDPITGVSALQRVGVTFTQSQKDAIKAMMDMGNTAGAQKIILAELSKEFGGSAEAAGKQLPGQIKILGQSFDDIKQTIGDAVIPVLQNLLTFVIANVVPGIKQFAAYLASPEFAQFGAFISASILPSIRSLAVALLPIITQFILWAQQSNALGITLDVLRVAIPLLIGGITVLVTVISSLISFFTQTQLGSALLMASLIALAIPLGIIGAVVIPPIIAGLIAMAISSIITGATMLIAFAPIIIPILAIILVITGLILLIQNWGAIMSFIGGVAINVWNGVKSVFSNVIGGIGSLFTGLGNLVAGVWNGIAGSVRWAINSVIDVINGFISAANRINVAGIGINIGLIPHLAAGTPDFAGGEAVVGEDGPELVRLPRGASVIPNNQLSQASQQQQATMTPVIFEINGVQFGRIMMPLVVSNVRTYVGVRM